MLKKLRDGFIFGMGFAIAFVVIWSVGLAIIIPRVVDSFNTKTPKFTNPKQAEILEPDHSNPVKKGKDFNFFKSADARMSVPKDGGILSMSTMKTPSTSKRPSTYQLWLTETSLWQIRTIEDKVEIEKLERPKNANIETLDNLSYEKVGIDAHHSAMTISADEINSLKSEGESRQDSGLNGKLRMTKEGVIFVYPNY